MKTENNPLPFVIGITATRCSGKDLLYQRFRDLSPRFIRYAFADQLKVDLEPLVRDKFGWDMQSLDAKQKEIVRPILIAYGMAQREIDPLYWVKIVCNSIDRVANYDLEYARQFIHVITDVRFENEEEYMRQKYGASFKLVALRRYDAPPPTQEEEKHYLKVEGRADCRLVWGNDTEEEQRSLARRVCRQLGISQSLGLD